MLALEEAIQGVEGVKRLTSQSNENAGSVAVELTIDADKGKAVNDVKSAIDRITTFPIDAEEPQVTELSLRREVISLVISGDQELSTLQELAEKARSVLREDPDVTQVEVLGVPPRELSIEIPRAVLESQGLTLDEVARQIRAASLDLSSGGIKTAGGELLIRVNDRRRTAKSIPTSSFGQATMVQS